MTALPQIFVESSGQLANISGQDVENDLEINNPDQGKFSDVLKQVSSGDEPIDLGDPETDDIVVTDELAAVVQAQIENQTAITNLNVATTGEAENIGSDSSAILEGLDSSAGSDVDLTAVPLEQSALVANTLVVQQNADSPGVQSSGAENSLTTSQTPQGLNVSTGQANSENNDPLALIENAGINPQDQLTEELNDINSLDLASAEGTGSDSLLQEIAELQTSADQSNAPENIQSTSLAGSNIVADSTGESSDTLIANQTEVADSEAVDAIAEFDSAFEASTSDLTNGDDLADTVLADDQADLQGVLEELGLNEIRSEKTSLNPAPQSFQIYQTTTSPQIELSSLPFEAQQTLGQAISQQTVDTIADSIARAQPPFIQSITLEIHPAELGQLNIQVEVVDESIQARIIASENLSAELLAKNRTELANALSDIGYSDANVDISHQNSNSDSGSEANRQFGGLENLAAETPIQSQTVPTTVVNVGVNLVA